jgi:hypothetical protein
VNVHTTGVRFRFSIRLVSRWGSPPQRTSHQLRKQQRAQKREGKRNKRKRTKKCVVVDGFFWSWLLLSGGTNPLHRQHPARQLKSNASFPCFPDGRKPLRQQRSTFIFPPKAIDQASTIYQQHPISINHAIFERSPSCSRMSP